MSEEKKREVNYGQDNRITVRNDFIKADYPKEMTATDLKLMRFVISQCRKNDTDFYEYSFSITDIAERFHVDRSNMYRAAHETIQRLFGCNLKIGSDKKYELLHIFKTAQYDTGVFTMQLSDEVRKLFLQLRRDFTNIPLLPVLAMKNKNSIRIYELICEKLMGHFPFADNAMSVFVELGEIRKVTETENAKSYDHLSHLKNKLVDPSIEEIEGAADWKIFLHDVKKGRKIIGFNLEIWSRNGWEYIEDCKRKGIIPERVEQIPGQQTIFDYL